MIIGWINLFCRVNSTEDVNYGTQRIQTYPGGEDMLENITGIDTNKMKITIAGVGGAGVKTVKCMMEEDFPNVELAVIDADWACVRASDVKKRVELKSNTAIGLGSGGRPGWAKGAAEYCEDLILDELRGADLVVIIAGFGGGTGSGASPVVAHIAHGIGASVLGIVTMPSDFEGLYRNNTAREWVEVFCDAADAVIIVPCEELIKVTGKEITILQFYPTMDSILCRGVRSLVCRETIPELEDLDFGGVNTIIRKCTPRS